MNGQREASGARRRGATVALILAAVGACLTAPLTAQNPQGRRGPPQDRQEMERRVRAQMARIVQERLELTNEESVQLGEVMQRFEERRRSIRRSEMATRRRVEALMMEDAEQDEEAAELLARLSELRQEESALFAEEQEALLQVLTPTQVLQLQALREEMGRRIRALRGGEQGDRPRRPGGVGQGNVDGLLGVPLST
jgi:Spy/CpxP family protein refolding chaperone